MALVAVLGLAGIGVGVYFAITSDSDEPGTIIAPPAPQVVVKEEAPAPEQPADLGFPAFATKNTTRVAAQTRSPTRPASRSRSIRRPAGLPGPDAVTLVDAGDWQAGIAAASLVARPGRRADPADRNGELPQLTATRGRSLAPAGSARTGGRQVFAIGAAASPAGFDAERSAVMTRRRWRPRSTSRDRAGRDPDHLLIATPTSRPSLCLPPLGGPLGRPDPLRGSAMRSRSATAEALHRHERARSSCSGRASADVPKHVRPDRQDLRRRPRVGGEDPVANSIAFARYADGNFGWNINDPGHGFVIAARPAARRRGRGAAVGERHLGAAAAHRRRRRAAGALRGYLLDVKPGYRTDPDPRLLQPRLGDRRPGGDLVGCRPQSTSSPSSPR